jgi:hypothetical protein
MEDPPAAFLEGNGEDAEEVSAAQQERAVVDRKRARPDIEV